MPERRQDRDGWTARCIGDLCDLRGGAAFPKRLQGHSSGSLPFIKVSDMSLPSNAMSIVAANHWISEDDRRALRAVAHPPGTTVFAKIGEGLKNNRFRLLTRPTLLDNNMMGASPKASVDARFLRYLLLAANIPSLAQGSALPYLRASDVAAQPVLVPSLPEQTRIADVLGALDDKIELNQRLGALLEERLLTIFAEGMFDAAASGREKLSDQIEVNPFRPKPKGSAPYIDMAMLPTESALVPAPESRPATSGARFVNGDTLMARITPCLENGKAAYIDCLLDGQVAVGSTEFIVLRPRGGLPAAFAYLLVRSPRFREYAIRHMSGSSGRQRCPAGSVAAYSIADPNPDSVARLKSESLPTFAMLRSLEDESLRLGQLRDSLLPALLAGELRLRDAEVAVGTAI